MAFVATGLGMYWKMEVDVSNNATKIAELKEQIQKLNVTIEKLEVTVAYISNEKKTNNEPEKDDRDRLIQFICPIFKAT